MMKKRILISILTLLFLVSTIGLPIYSHYCEMMEKKSLNECVMCANEVEQVEETSCCSEMKTQYQVEISDLHTRCCIDNFDYKKIEDNFSQPITFKLIFANDDTGILVDEVNNPENVKTQSYLNTYNLPPPQYGKELLNTIHQLKLDLPVC